MGVTSSISVNNAIHSVNCNSDMSTEFAFIDAVLNELLPFRYVMFVLHTAVKIAIIVNRSSQNLFNDRTCTIPKW
jgi:hypothetical protein